MSNILTYTVRNTSISAQAIGNVFLQPNSSTTVPFLNAALLTAASRGLITISPSDNDAITLQASYSFTTDGGGGTSTPGNVAHIDGTSLVTLQTTTANAVSTILAALNTLTAAVNNNNAANNFGASKVAALNV